MRKRVIRALVLIAIAIAAGLGIASAAGADPFGGDEPATTDSTSWSAGSFA
jgi:hypothetical protein